MLSGNALTLLALLGGAPADSLRAVVRTALAAVEGDSIARVRTRFESAASRNPKDPHPALGLAYLSLFTYDFPDATRQFQALRAGAGAANAIRAYATMGLAQTALGQGKAADADSLFGEAASLARTAESPPIEAEALLFRTLTTARINGPRAGLPLLARADSLIDKGDPALRARATCVRSQLTRSWDPIAAFTLALAGANAAAAAGSRRIAAFCFGVGGWALAQRGGTDSALTLFRRAIELQTQAHDRSALAATLQWQGYFLYDVGSYGPARAALTQALIEGNASGNLSPVAWAHNNLGNLTFATGELDEVATHLAVAESLYVQQGDQAGLYALAGIAVQRARAVGDTALARAKARQFGRDAARWGDVWPVQGQRTLAQVAMDDGDWAKARAHFDSALAAARTARLDGWVLAIRQDLGILELKRGNYALARRILEAMTRDIPEGQAAFRHFTLTELATAYLETGDVARAATTAVQAADELDRWRAGLDDRRLRQAAFDLRRSEDPSFAVASIIARLAAAGRAEIAFDLAERRRARYLLDRLVLADGLETTETRTNRPRSPVASLADIRRAIPDDSTAILEFVRGHAALPTTVFVLTRGTFRSVRLDPEPMLGQRVRRLVGLLEAGAPADSLESALGHSLLAPVLSGLPAGIVRLVVIPDQELHGLPLETLRVDGGLVVERFAVSYAPSASVIARLWQRPRASGPVTVLSLGDPRFAARAAAGSPASRYLSAFAGSGGLGRLPGTAREARAVARFADQADVRLGKRASEALLKREGLARYRVVHLATHALVDDRSVARTALALAPGDGEDGFVSPSEMAGLRLAADLVVLSACRSGRGPVVGGEGIQGLAAPALEAGARAVLASNWLVGDAAAEAFMHRYYRALARGLSLGDALQATKTELIRTGAAPGVWASFTLVGDPHTRLPLRERPEVMPKWIVGAAALAIALFGYGVIRRLRGRERTSTPSGSSATTTQR